VKKFTIFGDPVEHSISPKMHTFAIKELGLEATYTKTHLVDGSKLKEIFLKKFDGANVTVPHKETAFALCDTIKGIAKEIGAVNTLVKKNGKMIGYNTDAEGFLKSSQTFGEINSILILGAGGTAKALSTIFKNLGKSITILNRSKNRLEQFKEIKTYSWDTFKVDKYDLIVNTTSAGLQDNNLPAPKELMQEIFENSSYASDAIYNKETPFLKMAKEFNIPCKDGADMLLYQGVLAFDLFYDHQFELDEITQYMRQAFI
jgi:shikimate dehydrogenase